MKDNLAAIKPAGKPSALVDTRVVYCGITWSSFKTKDGHPDLVVEPGT
jgi:hypothetical protein